MYVKTIECINGWSSTLHLCSSKSINKGCLDFENQKGFFSNCHIISYSVPSFSGWQKRGFELVEFLPTHEVRWRSESQKRQFESMSGHKSIEWCHNEVGGQATN